MVEGFPCGAENLSFHSTRRAELSQALAALYVWSCGSSWSVGGLCVRGTPGPISNPVVKPDSAYGTWRDTARESRSPPRDLSLPANAHSITVGVAGLTA